nr:hypothetical protein [Rubellimicrobium aerolatum]
MTIEACLWIPLFFWLLTLICDASLVFQGKAQALRALEDGNRARAVHRLATEAETRAWIEARFDPVSPNAVARTTVADGIVTSTLAIPVLDLVSFNRLHAASGWSITVRAAQFVE